MHLLLVLGTNVQVLSTMGQTPPKVHNNTCQINLASMEPVIKVYEANIIAYNNK